MKKTILFGAFPLVILSLAVFAAVPASAQAEVACPAGYVCKAIAPVTTSSCPAGYVCTPRSNSNTNTGTYTWKTPNPPVSNPTSTNTACYSFQNSLSLGSTGADVVAIQSWLISNGYDIPAVSSGRTAKGYYGSQTAYALGKYQDGAGITVEDGILGPVTRSKVNSVCNSTITTPPIVQSPVSTGLAPTLSYITPLSVNAGATVYVHGSNFGSNTYVAFDGNFGKVIWPDNAPAGGSGAFSFTVPADTSAGAHSVQVAEKGSSFPLSSSVSLNVISANGNTVNQPSITVLSPNGGEAFTAGQPMTITFNPAGAYGRIITIDLVNMDRVAFDTQLGPTVTGQATDKQATQVTIPAGTIPGSHYKIRVTSCNPGDCNIQDLSDSTFTVNAGTSVSQPNLSYVTPNKGGAQTSVTIYGTNLANATNVQFFMPNGLPAASTPPTSSSGQSVSFTLGGVLVANMPAGDYQIRVVTPTGLSNPLTFTIASDTTPPTTGVQSLTPSNQTVASGQAASLNFTYPSNTVKAMLYIACPSGVGIGGAKGNITDCNTYADVTGQTSTGFQLINNNSSASNVVPNYYIYTSDKPNFAVGVSSQITVNPGQVTPPPTTTTGATCQPITINVTTYTLSPCTITASMTDGMGNKNFSVTITPSGGSSSYGYSVHGYGVGFPTYGVLGGSSGGASGNTVLNLYFNNSYLPPNGSQPQTYTGYLPIHIFQGSETSGDNNYLNLGLNLTVSPTI